MQPQNYARYLLDICESLGRYIFWVINHLTTLAERIQQMSYAKILNAAAEAFKQNFSAFCRNSEEILDKIDETNFNILSNSQRLS